MKFSSNSWHLNASDPIYTEPEYLLNRIQRFCLPETFWPSGLLLRHSKKEKLPNGWF